jgi:sugar O-acyltransferase (sialic acid O-acetyltransferase NeuD family)
MISVRDVEAAHAASAGATAADDADLAPWGVPLATEPGVLRIVLVGGGSGATQVLEILSHHADRAAVGILDDTPAKRGTRVGGVPVIGPTDRLAALFRDGAFEAAIVAFGAPVEARTRFREACAAAGIPLANAVDPTARIAAGAAIGSGNVLCAFVHLGTGAVLGDNNFLSAYNSFDHHCRVGNDCSTGPGCMASGNVVLGDRVRLGTGVFVEPGLRLGSDVQVASGAVIVRDVPDGHAVKTKVVTTAVVPSRRTRG